MEVAMRPRIPSLTIAAGIWLVSIALLAPAGAQEPFYKGKTIRLIVGLAAGGGYDVYSRTIARHIGKHIPGNPAIVVENMDGAGSLIAANHVYKVAKPDGLTIGHVLGGLFLQQLLGKPGIEFDALKFEYLGVPAQDHFLVVVSKSTGITDVEQWIASKKVITFGGVTPGGGTDDIPNLLRATIGLPVRIVSGYKGTAPIRLAFNSGEVQGVSNAWESLKVTWRKEYESGEAVIVLQATMKSHPELSKIPVAANLAKTDEAKKLIQTVLRVHGPSVRPYVVAPGTPKERVQMLRNAFTATMKDAEFLADTKQSKLDINPLSGQELEENVREIFKLEPALVEKLKEILK
jgi:tripartite-type tricarboxylate transporter receptor subunit TctC